MPTVQIWLTGVSIVSSTVQVYSNPTTPINHGTFITTVTKNCLTIDKPCEITIPDATTKLRLLDFATYCYWDIAICDSNVCQTCNLNFSNITSPNIGRLSVGNLVGSCDSSIDNFWVDWYGPNNSNLFSFSSGKGSLFNGYSNTFPLTGATSPPLPPGNYVGKIRYVELNGYKFSNPSTSGSVYSSTLPNCSLTQTVTSLTCLNQTGNDPYYSHDIQYQGSNPGGGAPAPLETYFTLNNNQSKFAFSFKAELIPDTLTLTLVRPSTNTEYVLENLRLGDVGSDNLCPNTWPKQYVTGTEVNKVLTLSQFNIISSDYIKINVQPSTEPLTNWRLKVTCPPTLTYEKTCYNQYKDQSYKIKLSSITGRTFDCSYSVDFQVYGCNVTNTTGFDNSMYKNYVTEWQSNTSSFTAGLSNVMSQPFQKPKKTYSVNNMFVGGDCRIPSLQSSYTLQKFNTPGSQRFEYTFTNLSDAQLVYNTIDNVRANLMLTYNPINSNLNYYKWINLSFPSATSSPFPCNQEAYSTSERYIHCTTTVTRNNLVVTVTTPTITWNPSVLVNSPGYCTEYYYLKNTLDSSNDAVNESIGPINYLYNIINDPICVATQGTVSLSTLVLPQDSFNRDGFIQAGFATYLTSTYPASSPGNTLIPSLSAKTSTFNDFIKIDTGSAGQCKEAYRQYFYKFKVRLVSVTPTLQFTIFAKQIVNYGENIDNDTIRPWISVYDSATPGTYNPTYITP